MLEILWVIGVGAAVVAFHRYVKERDATLQGGGDPVGQLEAVAAEAGAPFFANEARSVATVYLASPHAANVRMTRAGACAVVFPLASAPPFTGAVQPATAPGPGAVHPRRGLAPVEIPYLEWNATFAVFADEPSLVLARLTDDVVERFLAMARQGFVPRVVVNQTCARVDTRGLWRSSRDLRAFIDFACGVVDAFSLSVEAIEFRAARGARAPSCSVCGTSLAGATTVVCAHCDTPHHDDCWAYNGGCALFGCAGGPVVPENSAPQK